MSEKIKVCFYNAITREYLGDGEMNSITEDKLSVDGTDIISSYMPLNNSEFECTISDYNNTIVELFEECDTDTKPKPNPVYVPKHIEHRKKGRK